MNLKEIISNELNNEELNNNDETYVFEEGDGLFSISPLMAAFVLKDNAVNAIKSASKKVAHPVKTLAANVAIGAEKIKARTTGKSGNKDDDTVYTLTKEQRKIMIYLYNKYGATVVKEINNFRKNVMPPYQIIKRNLSRNRTLTNKEIFGMTKEDYYRYRESGRKKIEKRGTYVKDSKDLNLKQSEAREALKKAEKAYEDFKSGKIIDLSATNIEKILDEAGIGRKNLNGWSDSELEKTATEIKRLMDRLNNANLRDGENVKVGGSGKTARYESREQIMFRIDKLREQGISAVKGIKNSDTGEHHGSFKNALALYQLRREEINKMKSNVLKSDFKRYYEKVLKDAVEAAKKIYEEKFDNYISIKGTVELNQYENKIWGLKSTGVMYSGDINDWYLKIKPEDFIETKYYKKTDKIIEAEKEIDKLLKRFESKLKKIMSEEDVALCKKYRLFNNFLTVKEFKNSGSIFKDLKDDYQKKETTSIKKSEESLEDIENLIDSSLEKEYVSMKELEAQKEKVKNAVAGKKISGRVEEKYKKLMKKIDPKSGSSATKVSINKINTIIDKIENTEYTGKTQASSDYSELEDVIDDFTKMYGVSELSKFNYDIDKAKSKLLRIINDKETNNE